MSLNRTLLEAVFHVVDQVGMEYYFHRHDHRRPTRSCQASLGILYTEQLTRYQEIGGRVLASEL